MPRSVEPVDFLIVTPMAVEQNAVLDNLREYTDPDPGRPYYSAKIAASSSSRNGVYTVVVLPLDGIGQTEAAALTAVIVHDLAPRYVLLVGNAGANNADKRIKLGDVLIAEFVVCYDIRTETHEEVQHRPRPHEVDRGLVRAARHFQRHWDKLYSQERSGRIPCMFFGTIVTSNVVQERVSLPEIKKTWPNLVGVEMEASGVATAADVARAVSNCSSKPGFFMVRSVSDLADGQRLHLLEDQKEHWRDYASNIAAFWTIRFLQSAPVDFRNAPQVDQPDIAPPLPTIPTIATALQPRPDTAGARDAALLPQRRSSLPSFKALALVLVLACIILLIFLLFAAYFRNDLLTECRMLLAKGDWQAVLTKLPEPLNPNSEHDRPFVQVRAEAYLLKARWLLERKDLDGAIQTFGAAENDARESDAPVTLRATILEERAATLLERNGDGDPEAANNDLEARRQLLGR